MSEIAHIVTTPDILHGQPRIEGTRIGVFMLGEMIRQGEWTAPEVAEEYPDLSREQVDAALAYYDDHPEEMDAHRREREVVIQGLRERSRLSPDPDSDSNTDA